MVSTGVASAAAAEQRINRSVRSSQRCDSTRIVDFRCYDVVFTALLPWRVCYSYE